MSYCKKLYRIGNVIDVSEYHTARYGAPGQKRQKKDKATPEEMEKANQRTKTRKAWHKILANFTKGDYYITLTYRPAARPEDMQQAKKDFGAFMRIVRREYRKRGSDVKWIRNIEVGSRGAWHVHMIINAIRGGLDIIANAWKHGWIKSEGMYEDGRYKKLASYITKGPRTDQRLKESNYSSSRNLITPVPQVKHYLHYKTWRTIRIPKGYHLEGEVEEGINPWTGYPFRNYMLVKDGYESRLLC